MLDPSREKSRLIQSSTSSKRSAADSARSQSSLLDTRDAKFEKSQSVPYRSISTFLDSITYKRVRLWIHSLVPPHQR
jgi:hypothetical protein